MRKINTGLKFLTGLVRVKILFIFPQASAEQVTFIK